MKLSMRPGRNATYSAALGFVWFRVAKTGTRSVLHLLTSLVPDLRSTDTWKEVPADLRELLRDGAATFTIVRDPWRRLASAWLDKLADDGGGDPHRLLARNRRIAHLGRLSADEVRAATTDFGAFVRTLSGSDLYASDVHFAPQSEILGRVEPDVVGRFEHFESDLRTILHRIGLPADGIDVPHRNRTGSSSRPLEHWYDAQTREIVARLYHADIQRWGYRFDDGSAGMPS